MQTFCTFEFGCIRDNNNAAFTIYLQEDIELSYILNKHILHVTLYSAKAESCVLFVESTTDCCSIFARLSLAVMLPESHLRIMVDSYLLKPQDVSPLVKYFKVRHLSQAHRRPISAHCVHRHSKGRIH